MVQSTPQTMKKLTRIKLVNWHYFGNETIDVNGSFLLSGENASGKSTILDAIQLILTTNTRRFNPAANEKSKRDLKGYADRRCNEMAKCDFCGKGVTFGIKVSHSHRRSNRAWKPNVKRVKAVVNGTPCHVYACTRCLRSNKVERAI